ncbi:hypothetical protein CCR75_007244 [Bremia lactucae]|uniref:Uncharacterized protein n=1 Tax=Bremia lactucae TaxID=4779 RepID=A0A976ILG6_BRELC|nr:hypothetical protein CCR75_007244 [Bremia lactucae]
MLHLLRAARRASGPPNVQPLTAIRMRQLKTNRPNCSASSANKPLDRKDGATIASGLPPAMQMLLAYVAVAMSAVGCIGYYKGRDADEDEVNRNDRCLIDRVANVVFKQNVRIYNMAKRAVVKDHRVFVSIGYPKDFERIAAFNADGSPIQPKSYEGSFRITGDTSPLSGTVVVHYRQKRPEENNDIVTFDQLDVDCENGTQYSALESFLQNQDVVAHQKAASLGNKMFLPIIGGVLIGGVASFFAIRILRNRPFYVHKLVLDHINNHDTARQFLGHPIKSDRSKYVGMLTNEIANYTIACSGSKRSGTIIVKADKRATFNVKGDKSSEAMMTPGTSWKFSTLVLSISRNEKHTTKGAKTINLLSGGNATLAPSKQA